MLIVINNITTYSRFSSKKFKNKGLFTLIKRSLYSIFAQTVKRSSTQINGKISNKTIISQKMPRRNCSEKKKENEVLETIRVKKDSVYENLDPIENHVANHTGIKHNDALTRFFTHKIPKGTPPEAVTCLGTPDIKGENKTQNLMEAKEQRIVTPGSYEKDLQAQQYLDKFIQEHPELIKNLIKTNAPAGRAVVVSPNPKQITPSTD